MITGVIITKNEQMNIVDAISNLSFCDEVVVCDNLSKDKTVKIAKQKGAKVYTKKFNSYSDQRNFALESSYGDWVFFLDADERVSSKLRSEIGKIVGEGIASAVSFSRLDTFLGKPIRHGENGRIRLIRLARKDSGVWKRGVHEFWDVDGIVTKAKNPILHISPSDLGSYYDKINRFSKLHAGENLKEGKRSDILKIILIPALKFFDNYIIKLGFLDGTHGFIIAVSMSFHSFLAWSKMYQKNCKK